MIRRLFPLLPLLALPLLAGCVIIPGLPGLGHQEMREVTLGKSNDTHVAILSGLEEGDRVLLAPPAVYETAED